MRCGGNGAGQEAEELLLQLNQLEKLEKRTRRKRKQLESAAEKEWDDFKAAAQVGGQAGRQRERERNPGSTRGGGGGDRDGWDSTTRTAASEGG